jgi:hypothetical protein
MMSPHVYEEARASAPLHIQLWRTNLSAGQSDSGSLAVTGRIVRIFRNDGNLLRWGRRVSFIIPVIDKTQPPMPGGTIYHALERIGPAHFLEAFLNSYEGHICLVRSQVAAIRHPTLSPVCSADQKGFLCVGNI